MYGLGPSLPEAATTMTPSFTALLAATASGESAVPKVEPRDMLITSMSCSTDHSIASITTSEEPSQPKTRTAYRSAFGATPGPTVHWCVETVEALYGPR